MRATTGTYRTAPWVLFLLWALLGAGSCLAVLGVLTIGVFVAPVVAVLAWLLLRTAGADRSISGAVSGVSVMLFFVAAVNRDGPGRVCTVERHLTECAERWDPVPWSVAGLVFLAGGIVLFHLLGRRSASP